MSNMNSVAYIAEVTEEAEDSSAKSMVPYQESQEPLLGLISSLRDKFTSLPVPYDFGSGVSVTRLLSNKFLNAYSSESYDKSRRELAIIMLGLVGFIFISIIGWGISKEVNYLNGGGFVYNTGLIGGVLMLLTLLHSVVKRSTFISRYISVGYSYYFHVVCGAGGALLIVIHSSFNFRSINSSVAIFCMMLVLIAGALGRYLYTQFTLSLHRLYVDIKDTEASLYTNISAYNCSTADGVRERLTKMVIRNFKRPKNVISFLIRSFALVQYAIYAYVKSMQDIYRILKSAAILGDLDKQDLKKVKNAHKKELREYIYKVTKMGYLSLLEQMFRHWRVFHVPFLFILGTTAVVHVLVVHMY